MKNQYTYIFVTGLIVVALCMGTAAHAQRKGAVMNATTTATTSTSVSTTTHATQATSQSTAATTTPGTIYSTPTTPGGLVLMLVALCAVVVAWFGIWLVIVSEDECKEKMLPVMKFLRRQTH